MTRASTSLNHLSEPKPSQDKSSGAELSKAKTNRMRAITSFDASNSTWNSKMCTNLSSTIEINALRFGVNNILLFLWNVIQSNRIEVKKSERNKKQAEWENSIKIYSEG